MCSRMAFLLTSLPKNKRKIPRRSKSQMLCQYIQQCFQMVGYCINYIFGEGFLVFISNGLYHSKHRKVFATHPNIIRQIQISFQYRTRITRKGQSSQREETRLKSFTGQLSKMAISVCYQNCQLSPFINKISRSAYILPFDVPEMYLGFTYQPVPVDSDNLTQANLFSYLRKKSPFSRYFSALKNLNPLISNLCDKQPPQKKKSS